MTINKLFTRRFGLLDRAMWDHILPLHHQALTPMGKWSKGLTDWQAFEEVTSGTSNVPHGKKPMAPEDIEEGDEDFDASSEDQAEDEDDE
jgi:hypothetical protein